MGEGSINRNSGLFYQRVAIIGTGLIGGSIGLALRERRLVGEIIAYSRGEATRVQAVERGAADRSAASAAEAVQGADLVIIAVPVMSTEQVLKEILPALAAGTVVTDVGSTKERIMEVVKEILPPSVYFIGGHPMAGSEESGIGGADAALLENAIYVLTPAASVPELIVANLAQCLQAAGAQPLIIDSAAHDRAVAMVSHLPHIVAAALVRSVAEESDSELVRTLAAGGFRDSTRIALGDPVMWRDICLSNLEAILNALQIFKRNVDGLYELLSGEDAGAIEQYLQQAREYRRTIPYRGRGILPDLHEVIVLVSDVPGVIGTLAGLLGEAGINISSIEILHVRELAGGSIRLGFRDSAQQCLAQQLLNDKGYRTHNTAV